MKASKESKVARYVFAVLMLGLAIDIVWLSWTWLGRNNGLAAVAASAGVLAAGAIWFHLRIWKKTENHLGRAEAAWASADQNWRRVESLQDYSARTWWETGEIQKATDRLRRGENVDYAPCALCGHELPAAALLLEGDVGLICARCSPEAKVAGRGTYKAAEVIPAHQSSER